MNIYNSFRKMLGFNVGGENLHNKTVVQVPVSSPTYSPNSFESFVNNGYTENEILYAALNLRANSVIEADLVTKINDEVPSSTDPLLQILLHPNNYHTHAEFFKLLVMYLDFDGNVFIVKEMTKGRKVKALHMLRPDLVGVIPSTKPGEMIKKYEYKIGNKKVFYAPDEVIHIKTPNPLTPWRGISPIQPIIKSVDLDNDAINYTKSVLENKGVPGGILKVLGNVGKEAIRRMQAQWSQQTTSGKRGNIAILGEEVEYIPTSMSLAELDLRHINILTESRILTALGINPVIMGSISGNEASTYNNVAEAKLSFYQQTIVPLQFMITDAFTNDPDINPGNTRVFFFDPTDVSALAPLRAAKQEQMSEGYRDGWLTINELRDNINLPPVDGGDEMFLGTTDVGGDHPTESDMTGSDKDPKKDPKKEPKKEPKEDSKSIEEVIQTVSKEIEKKEQAQLEMVDVHIASVRKVADDGFDDMLKWSENMLSDIFDDINKLINNITKGLEKSKYDEMLAAIVALELVWTDRVYKDLTLPIKTILTNSANAQKGIVGIGFRINDNQVREFLQSYKFKFADRISKTASKSLTKILLDARDNELSLNQLSSVIHEEFKGKVSKNKARMIAQTETIRAANQGTLAAYKSAGVTSMRWLAGGDACPYCKGLDGKVVSIGEPFVKGNTYMPEGAKTPLDTSYTEGIIETPPAHVHCQCVLNAEEF